MYTEIEKKLKKKLSQKRFQHSLRVAETARYLAQLYKIDQDKAYLAGLLHDCARDMSHQELLSYVQGHKLVVGDYEQNAPALLHTIVGADLAGSVYGVNDPEVLGAIRCHTLGGKEMSPLQKIIYVADFIEPGRNDLDVRQVQQAAEQDLDTAVYEKARFMLEYSRKMNEQVHPDVVATVEYFQKK
jgi:predicted HD superfamily hydrolase involved in NAD metabolism